MYTILTRLALTLLINSALTLSAQILPENLEAKDWSQYFPKALPSFPSPNAEAFMVFGQIPVTKYTGTPDIRIPIYTLNHCDISVPINLAYHTANRKVNSMPSWVGLGWNMDAGGVITRTIRGKRDENASTQSYVYNGAGFPQGFMHNNDLWEDGVWQHNAKLKGNIIDPRVFHCILPYPYTEPLQGPKPFEPLDALPDEYNFNFLDFSGKFHFDPYTESFIVESDANIKVIFDPSSDIVQGRVLQTAIDGSSNWLINPCNTFEDYIIHFQLITPDGFLFDFGGTSATEVSAPRQNTHSSQFSTSSWFLTKITSPSGNIVTFNYDRGEVICNLSSSYQCTRYKSSFFHCSSHECPPTEVATRNIDGQVIYPVYLKSIIADQTKIEFQKNNAQALRYSYEDQNKPNYNNVGTFSNSFSIGLNGIWKKLNAILIYEGQTLAKKFSFSYIDSPSERLKLQNLREQSPYNTDAKDFTFQYNTNKLPAFCSESVDHWGYANNFDGLPYVGTGDNFYERKEPSYNPSTYLAEILEKITYPSGGYTLLEYEPHDYAKVVTENRSALNSLSQTKVSGGVRVKSIASYDSERYQTQSIKTYIYRKGGHLSHTIPSINTLSSGILSSTPKYLYYSELNQEHPAEPDNVYSLFSSGLIVPFGDAAFGNHVGYSEVTEIESTRTNANLPATLKSFNRSFFSNFDEDIYGNSHMDIGPSGINGSIHNGQMFISFSRSAERGKLLLERQYRSNGSIVSETQNSYEVMLVDKNTKTMYYTFDYYPACNIRGYHIDYESRLGIIPFSYLLKSTRYTLYGINTNDSLIQFTENIYNLDRQITSIRTADSYGNTIETVIKYPRDFTINPYSNDLEISALRLMANHKHMINKPIVVYQTKNNQVVAATFQTFSTFTNSQISDRIAILPYRLFELKLKQGARNFLIPSFSGSSPSIEAQFELQHTCELYDDHGNLRVLRDKLGITSCLIWGYNKTLPTIMIVNANWNTISAAIDVSSIENSNNEDVIKGISNTLRQHSSLKQAQIFTYTYKKPWGISSITDPSGITTHYQYDGLGRLLSIKDNNFNILEKIIYEYKLK